MSASVETISKFQFHKRWIPSIPTGWNVQKIKFNSYVKGRIGWQNLRKDEFTEEGPTVLGCTSKTAMLIGTAVSTFQLVGTMKLLKYS